MHAGINRSQVRLRVVHDTTGATLCAHVHRFTQPGTQLYTDENNGYNHVIRSHATVCHANREYARDDNGIREVHCNTVECMWTDVHNFLRPFKGVHKKYLASYVAMTEFKRNLKRISPDFIAALVPFHIFRC